MRRAGSEAGFTLVEMLVVMAISVAAMSGVLGALEVMLRQSVDARKASEAQDVARTGIDGIAVALRNAMAAPGVAPTAIERDGTDDLVFQTVDHTTTPAGGSLNQFGAMRVRYCLDAADPLRSMLRRQTQRWMTANAPGIPPATACNASLNGWQDNRVVVTDLVNRARGQSVWTYGPIGYATLANIRSVESSLIVDVDPTNARGERKLTGGVSLRNANRPPIAAFTYSRVGAYLVANATGSIDQDGDSLEYEWWVDGVRVTGAKSPKLQIGLAPGPHTIKLIVKDPSGLTGEDERTVPA